MVLPKMVAQTHRKTNLALATLAMIRKTCIEWAKTKSLWSEHHSIPFFGTVCLPSVANVSFFFDLQLHHHDTVNVGVFVAVSTGQFDTETRNSH